MFCKKCGIELKEGAKFCSACGTPVGARYSMETLQTGNRASLRETFLHGPAYPERAKRIAQYVACGLMLLLIGLWFVAIYRCEVLMKEKNLSDCFLKDFTSILSVVLYGAAAGLMGWGVLRNDESFSARGRIVGVVAICRHAVLLLLSGLMESGKYAYETTFGFSAVAAILLLTALCLYYLRRGPMFSNLIPRFDLSQATVNGKRTLLYACLGVLLLALPLLHGADLYNLVASKGDQSLRVGFSVRDIVMSEESVSGVCTVSLLMGIASLILCGFRVVTKMEDGRRRSLILPILTVAVNILVFVACWFIAGSEIGKNPYVSVHWSFTGWIFVLFCAASIYLMTQLRLCDGSADRNKEYVAELLAKKHEAHWSCYTGNAC